MIENGKVLSECKSQVTAAAAVFRFFAGACETLGSEITPSRGNYLSMTVYEPYGVVAAITPWNSPLTMEAQKSRPSWLPEMRLCLSHPKSPRLARSNWAEWPSKPASRRVS